MNIVLGAYLLSSAPSYRQAGVHRYAQHLLQEIARIAARHPEAHFTALVSPTVAPQGLSMTDSRFSILPASRSTERPLSRILIEQTETPRVLRERKADLYHGLGFVAPLRAPCPTIVTVFDLSFITQPQAHKRVNRLYLSLFTRWSCRRAARVIAISEWTRRDVAQHLASRRRGSSPFRWAWITTTSSPSRQKPLPPSRRNTALAIRPSSTWQLGAAQKPASPDRSLLRSECAIVVLPSPVVRGGEPGLEVRRSICANPATRPPGSRPADRPGERRRPAEVVQRVRSNGLPIVV